MSQLNGVHFGQHADAQPPTQDLGPRKSVCLISGGIVEKQIRLQPWRYLHEVARQLSLLGHPVTILSDGGTTDQQSDLVDGIIVRRIGSVQSTKWQANGPLQAAIDAIDPQVLLWHVGVTSFLPQRDFEPRRTAAGIFTSPLYTPAEMARLGIRKLAKGYRLSAMHILGTALPHRLLQRGFADSGLKKLVVQSRATHDRLLERGIDRSRVTIIPPGVDAIWGQPSLSALQTRIDLGYGPDDTVVVYFGSPAALRGLHSLIRAVGLARQTDTSLKLLILSRRRADELMREDAALAELLGHSTVQHYVKVVSGFLPEAELVGHVAAANIVSLPFELIPSDAPLSLLEAQALGKPVVTTRLGCLPELVTHVPLYLAEPADPVSLGQALNRASHDLRAGEAGTRIGDAPDRSWHEVGEAWSRFIHSL